MITIYICNKDVEDVFESLCTIEPTPKGIEDMKEQLAEIIIEMYDPHSI